MVKRFPPSEPDFRELPLPVSERRDPFEVSPDWERFFRGFWSPMMPQREGRYLVAPMRDAVPDVREAMTSFGGTKVVYRDPTSYRGHAGEYRAVYPYAGWWWSEPLPEEPLPLPPETVYAATALITEPGQMRRRRILAVSRKTDHEDFGLPGGKLEPGETPEECMRREVAEETGLRVNSVLGVVYAGWWQPGKYDICFRVDVEGEISSTESAVVKWVDPPVLTASKYFGEFNRKVLDRFARDGF